MKTFKQKDKYFETTIKVLVFVLGIFISYLFSFVFAGQTTNVASNIETLDKATLNQITSGLTERQDVDTNGKPNLNNINFGNEEPFR